MIIRRFYSGRRCVLAIKTYRRAWRLVRRQLLASQMSDNRDPLRQIANHEEFAMSKAGTIFQGDGNDQHCRCPVPCPAGYPETIRSSRKGNLDGPTEGGGPGTANPTCL